MEIACRPGSRGVGIGIEGEPLLDNATVWDGLAIPWDVAEADGAARERRSSVSRSVLRETTGGAHHRLSAHRACPEQSKIAGIGCAARIAERIAGSLGKNPLEPSFFRAPALVFGLR
jgi:hypothetical protein